MIKYVKLSDATELPCLVCGKKKTNIFIVEEIENKKQKHYMCENCFKAFKATIKDVTIKEYRESDIATIIR